VTFSSLIDKYPLCDVALAYPWLEIRKNEAYPVFTHASSDQQSPWLNAPADFDSTGQMNAYFRWKNRQDTATDFAMQIWIAHPAVKTPPVMPATATADITLRRLQKFKIQPGESYTWHVSRDGRPAASGRVNSDAVNLLTIPRVELTTTPVELSVKANEP
jgi:hypothetical protein